MRVITTLRSARRARRGFCRATGGTITVAAESPAAGTSPRRHASSSAIRSLIDAKRSRGSFASARRTHASSRGGTSGRVDRTLGMGSWTCRIATATGDSASSGTAPSAARRARRRASRRRLPSPAGSPFRLFGRDVVARAHGSSRSASAPRCRAMGDAEVGDLHRPSSASRTFCGLMSRWTTPRWCAASSAWAIWMPRSITVPTGSAPSRRTTCLRFSPSTYSKRMYGRPSSSPRSMTVTMFGWCELRGGAGLPLEALDRLLVGDVLLVEDLHRDGRSSIWWCARYDRRHPARADHLLELEPPRNHLPDHPGSVVCGE